MSMASGVYDSSAQKPNSRPRKRSSMQQTGSLPSKKRLKRNAWHNVWLDEQWSGKEDMLYESSGENELSPPPIIRFGKPVHEELNKVEVEVEPEELVESEPEEVEPEELVESEPEEVEPEEVVESEPEEVESEEVEFEPEEVEPEEVEFEPEEEEPEEVEFEPEEVEPEEVEFEPGEEEPEEVEFEPEEAKPEEVEFEPEEEEPEEVEFEPEEVEPEEVEFEPGEEEPEEVEFEPEEAKPEEVEFEPEEEEPEEVESEPEEAEPEEVEFEPEEEEPEKVEFEPEEAEPEEVEFEPEEEEPEEEPEELEVDVEPEEVEQEELESEPEEVDAKQKEKEVEVQLEIEFEKEGSEEVELEEDFLDEMYEFAKTEHELVTAHQALLRRKMRLIHEDRRKNLILNKEALLELVSRTKATKRQTQNRRKCGAPNNEVIYQGQKGVLNADQERRAKQLMSKVQSGNPAFLKVITASSLTGKCGISIPRKFSAEQLPKETRNVVLCRPKKEMTWPVKYYYRKHCQTFEGSPWRKFVLENNLQEGDICMFEMIRSAEQITFVVHMSTAL